MESVTRAMQILIESTLGMLWMFELGCQRSIQRISNTLKSNRRVFKPEEVSLRIPVSGH